VPICKAVLDFGAAWSVNDTIVFRENAPGLLRVSPAGGEPTRFTNEAFTWPTFLPGGKSLLVQNPGGGIPIVSVQTGEAKRLTDLGATPRYVRGGHLIYEYERSLYVARFDLETLALTSPPVPVVERVRKTLTGPAEYDVSSDGSPLYLPGGSRSTSERRLVWVDRRGRFDPVTDTQRPFRSPRLSPDGSRIAVEIVEGPQAGDVWLHDVRQGALRRITLGGNSFFPAWGPDGGTVTLSRFRSDAWSLVRGELEGSGEQELLLQGGHPTAVWVVFTSTESGAMELYVRPFSDPGRRWQVTDSGGRDPVWTSGGKEIVFRKGRRILSVAVETEPDFHASAPQILFEGPFELETGGFRNFDVTRDGQRFIMVLSEDEPLDRPVFVVNWAEELKRLVPSQ
jgi:hypothetical protein